jgi:Raf kinase inhibitor-like YbhB/YbcL family protein
MKKTLIATALIGSAALAQAAGFTLSSPDIKPGSSIGSTHVFNGFGCSGENKSPALKWSGAPAGTKSYVLTVYDPDAPTGSGWWHWVVINLPGDATEIAAGAGAANSTTLPKGAVQGRTDFGSSGWGGPCPPVGDKAHRYIFTVHALKVDKLDLPADASAALTGFMTNANSLGKASFTALYGRKK